jgi:hypothetical protein
MCVQFPTHIEDDFKLNVRSKGSWELRKHHTKILFPLRKGSLKMARGLHRQANIASTFRR